jgi:hypothetical protein
MLIFYQKKKKKRRRKKKKKKKRRRRRRSPEDLSTKAMHFLKSRRKIIFFQVHLHKREKCLLPSSCPSVTLFLSVHLPFSVLLSVRMYPIPRIPLKLDIEDCD